MSALIREMQALWSQNYDTGSYTLYPGPTQESMPSPAHRVAIVYPPVEVMRQAVQQTTKETN